MEISDIFYSILRYRHYRVTTREITDDDSQLLSQALMLMPVTIDYARSTDSYNRVGW